MTTLSQRIHNAQDSATLQYLLDEYKQTGADMRWLSIPSWYEYGFSSLADADEIINNSLSLTKDEQGIPINVCYV